MAILKSIGGLEADEVVTGNGVYLRYPVMGDYGDWAALRDQSRDFLTPWEPIWPVDDLTRPAFRRRLRRYSRELKEDISYPFFLFREVDDQLLGSLIISNVRRGVAQSCSLGYWVGKEYAGKGLMTEAARGVVPFVFDRLSLHRIEAACLLNNEPSQKLLRRVGFSDEGVARKYLRINGEWQDHLQFAMLASDTRL
jgi:[ribosomal protein S5]-alanine N-acetyltransferase